MPPALVPRFGPFELDVRTGELRKHGIPVRLPEQSFQILLMLLENPGEVVLRSDIRQRLWSGDTVVDFDQSISSAVRRLRSALGDSADSPRYIETLAKRGYRFRGKTQNTAATPDETPKAAPAPRYKLLEKLGEGGMGTVYRANDLQLERQVAVKLLRDRDGRARQGALLLNHPNICNVYGVEAFPDGPGIVMELVGGETLSARLARGPMATAEAVDVSLQIAAALEAAHCAGVLHGDLKPSHVVLTGTGVKVLDFGSERPATDAHGDIFSLGRLLTEMVGGPEALIGVAPTLSVFIRRCLAPDPAARWESAGAAKEALQKIKLQAVPGKATEIVTAERWPRQLWMIWTGAAIAVVLASFLAWRFAGPFRATAEVAGVSRLTGAGDIKSANISPDGRYVAYVSGTRDHYGLWLKQRDAENGMRLVDFDTDTCGGVAFAPDGQSLYFTRKHLHDPNGTLYRIAIAGGYPEPVLNGISGEPFPSPDGRRIAFVRSTLSSGGEDTVVVSDLAGKNERELARYPPPGIHHNELAWTGDATRLGYIAMGKLTVIDVLSGQTRQVADQNWFDFEGIASSPYAASEILLTAIRPGGPTPHQIFRVLLDGNDTRQLTHEAHYRSPRATASGDRILVMRDESPRTIHVVTFDARVTDRLVVGDTQMIPNQGVSWTPEGRILFASKAPDEDRGNLWIVDGDGSNRRRVRKSEGTDSFSLPTMAAQGQTAAFTVWKEFDRAHISVMDLSSGQVRQLTAGVQDDEPMMSPDGKWVFYRALRGQKPVLMRVSVDGGSAVQLTEYAAERPAISPDGKWLACFGVPGKSGSVELLVLPAAGGSPVKVFALPSTAKLEVRPEWTPDGGALSYVNRVNGSSNIWNQSVHGGEPKAITNFVAQEVYHFNWSRDKRLALAMGTDTTDAMLLHVKR